jgi:hypothetical protein
LRFNSAIIASPKIETLMILPPHVFSKTICRIYITKGDRADETGHKDREILANQLVKMMKGQFEPTIIVWGLRVDAAELKE